MTQVQAAKFDYIGDYNYLIYASRNKYNMTHADSVNERQITATLRIYAPHHNQPVFEAELPFYDGYKRERYWVAFCLKGGHGLNKEGLSLSDPAALFLEKPSVGKDCVLDPQKYVSFAVPQPFNLQVQ